MTTLAALVAAELAEPVDPRVAAMAAAIAARHGMASRAVLFYGSCLRQKELEGLMLDFYLIVSDYPAAYDKRWLATANRLIPPNVFPFTHDGLAAKYAVLSVDHFLRECSAGARSVSVWARFAQPVRLVWAEHETSRSLAIQCVADAVQTFLAMVRTTLSDTEARNPLAIWRRGLQLTYGAELRSESANRPDLIIDENPERYLSIARAAGYPRDQGIDETKALKFKNYWRHTQRRGKWISVLRLAKASLTFAGGIDYLAWKISRHADVPVTIQPWQRRWPLLGAMVLVPKLLRQGAIR